MRRNIAVVIMMTLHLAAGYTEGKAIFEAKCTPCHGKHINADKIKENFFEKNNTVLNMKAPTVNMLAYALIRSPLHIGDPNDPEMQQIEIEEFLKEYLYKPNRDNSICDPNILKYYVAKENMKGKVSEEEIVELATFFMQYKAMRTQKNPSVKKVLTEAYSDKDLLADATKNNSVIVVKATSQSCYFCKKMKREVIETDDVQKALQNGFVYVEVDVDKAKLPLGLDKTFKKLTPTFFFVSSTGKLLATYPGSWKKEDFLIILKENRGKKD